MGAFELQDLETLESEVSLDHRRVCEERIIAFILYDSCRSQICLTHAEIGPARAAEQLCVGEEHHRESDMIKPPPQKKEFAEGTGEVLKETL